MRIRFVTKAQLQVLQASRVKKHTMQDGPMPLFGSLPSAGSRQWGLQEENKKFLLPLTVNQFIAMTSTHKTGNNTSVRNAVNSDNLPNIYIATDLGSLGLSYYIVIGT